MTAVLDENNNRFGLIKISSHAFSIISPQSFRKRYFFIANFKQLNKPLWN